METTAETTTAEDRPQREKKKVSSVTLKRGLLKQMQRSIIYVEAAKAISKLPVAPKDERRKAALVKEARVLARQQEATARRIRALADRLARLPVESKLLPIREVF